MKKEELRNRGITLIALIITIIVMMILVAITVSVALNGGLISKTQEARRGTKIGMVKDMVYADAGAKQAENEGDKITRSQLKGILEKYFTDVPDILGMTEEELGEVKLTLKEEYGGYEDVLLTDVYSGVYLTERELVVADVLVNNLDSQTLEERSPFVEYNNMLWRVLYDEDSGYGIQLVLDTYEISKDKLLKITLGYDDPLSKDASFDWVEPIPIGDRYLDDPGPTIQDLSVCVDSYSNAIARMNAVAALYTEGGDSDVVASSRAFGTPPTFLDAEYTPYTFDDMYSWLGSNTLLLGAVNDVEFIDYERCNSINVSIGGPSSPLFIFAIKETSFGSSLKVNGVSVWTTGLGLLTSNEIWTSSKKSLISVNAEGRERVNIYSLSGYVVPVVKLKDDITIVGGKGTEEDPYTLACN